MAFLVLGLLPALATAHTIGLTGIVRDFNVKGTTFAGVAGCFGIRP